MIKTFSARVAGGGSEKLAVKGRGDVRQVPGTSAERTRDAQYGGYIRSARLARKRPISVGPKE